MKQLPQLHSTVRASSSVVAPGRRFGPYEILAKIAEGGMGNVYLARKRGSVARLFALKVETIPSCPDGSRGIENEARIGGSVQHANVIPVLDFVTDARGTTALVMDYVPGSTLSRLIRGANSFGAVLPLPMILRVIFDASTGLAAVHRNAASRRGPVIHRDVAPANLLVGDDGVTRLGDFGVAIAVDALGHPGRNAIEGRISYMAPERLLGRTECDPRSDLFAIGVVLWESVSGMRLFGGADDVEARARVLAGEVPSLERFRRGGGMLDPILARALAPDPEDRFASADALLDALEMLAPSLGGFATSRAVAASVAAFGAEALNEETLDLEAEPCDSLAETGVDDEPPTIAAVPELALASNG